MTDRAGGGGAVVDGWLREKFLTFFSEVVYRSALLIGFEGARSAVDVSKHIPPYDSILIG